MNEEKYKQLSIYDFLNEDENKEILNSNEKILKKIEILEMRFSLAKDEKLIDATNQLIAILKKRLKREEEWWENQKNLRK